MKKLLALGVAVFSLTACMGSTPANFDALSKAAIKAEIEKIEQTAELLGVAPNEASGKFSVALEGLNVPSVKDGNFSLSFDYKALSQPLRNLGHMSFISPTIKASGKYVDLLSEGAQAEQDVNLELSTKGLDYIAAMGQFYIKSADVKFNIDTDNSELKQLVSLAVPQIESFNRKLANKWINMLPETKDLEGLKNVSLKMATLSQKDLVALLTEHNLLKQEGDAQVAENRYTYNVSLHEENVRLLAQKLKKDMTGKDLTQEEKDSLNAEIQKVKVSGMVTFDTKNPHFADYRLTLTVDSKEIPVNILRDGEALKAHVALPVGKVAIDAVTNGDEVTASLQMPHPQLGEMKIASVVKNKKPISFEMETLGETVPKLKLAIKKDGVSEMIFKDPNGGAIEIKNTVSGDDFTGNALVSGKEVAKWKGKFPNNTLESLEMEMMNPETNQKIGFMNLQKNGSDMATGKFEIDVEGKKVTSDVSLQIVGDEKFGIILDNIALPKEATVSGSLKKFSMFASGKKEYKNVDIKFPADAMTADEVQNALLSTQQQ